VLPIRFRCASLNETVSLGLCRGPLTGGQNAGIADLVVFNEVAREGHFTLLGQPALLIADNRETSHGMRKA
jgi:hypothetical protein